MRGGGYHCSAAETDHVWSWMADLKATQLCRMLTAAIRTDRQLQQGLHIVSPPSSQAASATASAAAARQQAPPHPQADERAFTEERARHDAGQVIQMLAGNERHDHSGMPRGTVREALAPQSSFDAPRDR